MTRNRAHNLFARCLLPNPHIESVATQRTLNCGAALLLNESGAPVGAASNGMVPLELPLFIVAALAAATAASAVASCAGDAVLDAVGPLRSYVTPHCRPTCRE